jgi:hypothetical protein
MVPDDSQAGEAGDVEFNGGDSDALNVERAKFVADLEI